MMIMIQFNMDSAGLISFAGSVGDDRLPGQPLVFMMMF
jgi:hypothetical protein